MWKLRRGETPRGPPELAPRPAPRGHHARAGAQRALAAEVAALGTENAALLAEKAALTTQNAALAVELAASEESLARCEGLLQTCEGQAPNLACQADLSGDGFVNFRDLGLFKSVFFEACTQ